MPTATNITGPASPEQYRQPRGSAKGHATTAPAKVRDSSRPHLQAPPHAVNQARNPGAHPHFAAASARSQQTPKTSAYTRTNPPRKPQYEVQKAVCIPVKRT